MTVKAAIWDLDGTLINSYDNIVHSLCKVMRANGQAVYYEAVRTFVKEKSVYEYLEMMSKRISLSFEALKKAYSDTSLLNENKLKVMPQTLPMLKMLNNDGVRNFLYTHKGKSTAAVLKRLKLLPYFEEIVTGEDGFRRKPDGEALEYLIDKYNLKKNHTFYIGDRRIDVECAKDAGIKSILYGLQSCVPADYQVKDLLEIPAIIKSCD